MHMNRTGLEKGQKANVKLELFHREKMTLLLYNIASSSTIREHMDQIVYNMQFQILVLRKFIWPKIASQSQNRGDTYQHLLNTSQKIYNLFLEM